MGGSIIHTIFVQFKAGVEQARIQAVCEALMAMKTKCIHPTTQATYILSVKGGKDMSPYGLNNGLTHGFAVEFASVEDRNYYADKDPVHTAVAGELSGLVDKVVALDFVDGEF